jgi:hypothetical protein
VGVGGEARRGTYVKGGLHESERSSGENESLEVESRHENTCSTIERSQDVLLRYLAVLKHELRSIHVSSALRRGDRATYLAGVGTSHSPLVELLVGRESLEPLLDDEGRDSLGSLGRLSLGVHDQRRRIYHPPSN